MAGTVRITGLKETVKSLEKLGVEIQDLKKAFKEVGDLVANDARSRAPKRTGALAASIKSSNAKNKAVVRAGNAKVVYAGVINYGWPRHNIAKQNYLDNAADSNKEVITELIEQNLEKLLRQLNLSGG